MNTKSLLVLASVLLFYQSAFCDLKQDFVTPPSGYGEVAFYWWQGDTLRKDRLLEQLNMLQGHSITSLQINYAHDDYFDEQTGARPHYPTVPEVMTDKWWELVSWFADEAGKRGISLSLSDYCLGIGQKSYFDDILREHPDVCGYILKCDSLVTDAINMLLPSNVVSVTAFGLDSSGNIIGESLADLRGKIKNGVIAADFGSARKVYIVYAEKQDWTYDPMNRYSGQGIIDYFYGEFERHIPGEMGKNLNYFFSDELNFKLKGKVWNQNFAKEFKRRKGYDICPELAALWTNIGRRTSKVRLDYNDVYVSLSEENYFKPIFDFNERYGMTLGCDHGGRGYVLDEFGDYFRTQRWNQGPGSDQPFLAKSIIKAKVAASIAHMYERPRVWLEGFYGSGWSTNTAQLSDAIFANMALGYNLLTLHGLYYTTYGRWWEWAPPCNHFHMPYWQHMAPFLSATERLCFLLSQGKHVADIAILYPVEAVVANPVDGKRSAGIAFKAGEELYKNGYDFDYIDFQSLHRAEVVAGKLKVAGEAFSVVIVPSMKAIRHDSLKKLLEFSRNGGIVINIGDSPLMTEKDGVSDEVAALVNDIRTHKPNVHYISQVEDIFNVLENVVERDFKAFVMSSDCGYPYFHHRRIGGRDVYAIYNAPKGTECYFAAKGNVELWDAMTGESYNLTKVKETAYGTIVEMPLSDTEMQIIVISPDDLRTATKAFMYKSDAITEIPLGKEWNSDIIPVLNNNWGDYYLPATNENIGPWVEQFLHTFSIECPRDDDSWKEVSVGYGSHLSLAGPFKNNLSAKEINALLEQEGQWNDYRFSWRYGVEGDCGRQGYHGLKGKIHNDFIRLGEKVVLPWSGSMVRKEESAGTFYYLRTHIDAPTTGIYQVLTDSIKPSKIMVDGATVDANQGLKLIKGQHELVLEYQGPCSAYFIIKDNSLTQQSERPALSMKWNNDHSILRYSKSLNNDKFDWYKFDSAPGIDSISFSAYFSDFQLFADGKECKMDMLGTHKDGSFLYGGRIECENPGTKKILIKARRKWGYSDGAAFSSPIKQFCGKGRIMVGDWSKTSGMKNYAGGIRYSKLFHWDKNSFTGSSVEIDLHDVVSTAEVILNGQSLGVRYSKPWTFDITMALKDGENIIEIVVYNTLGNIYSTIPTVYAKDSCSGLIGEPILIVR